jgi:NAD(P)-dependent dehydrogenase (short-subunit alcohol dehydrogenase family)
MLVYHQYMHENQAHACAERAKYCERVSGFIGLSRRALPIDRAYLVPEFNSRVVIVSSSADSITTLRESDDYNFEKGGYDGQQAYANSKLANIYMANEIERRYGAKGLHGLSLHPGGIGDTNLFRHMGGADFVANVIPTLYSVKLLKSSEQVQR